MEYGNLALDERYEYRSGRRKRKPQKRNNRTKRNQEQMLNRKRNIRRMVAVVAMAISAGFMISEFVTVHETRAQLSSLNKELSEQEAITSQKVFALEQSIDLGKIERIATTRLGMQRPENYQTIYVNVKSEDVTDVTAGDVEGVGNALAAFFKSAGSHIVKLFSIQ